MKVAIVHDSLTEFGGAERVLQTLIKLYPHADIFSLYANQKVLNKFFYDTPVSSFHFSLLHSTLLNGHNTLCQIFSPLVWRLFNFQKYDLVISNSFYLLGNQVRVNKAVHIQYINCPPKNLFTMAKKRPLQKIFPYTSILSRFYQKAIKSTPYIIANSYYMKEVVKKLFGVNASVIYPPVRIPPNLPVKKVTHYFIIVSRIDRSKCLELAIRACNNLQLPLKIVGKTNERKYEKNLKNIAGPTIEFLGEKTDNQLKELFKSARAFIFTSKEEDFGIAPIEAMAHGVPVIAYYGGGLRETIIHGKTGLFFYEHNVDSLVKTIKKFLKSPKKFNINILYNYSKNYSEDRFKKEFVHYTKNIS